MAGAERGRILKMESQLLVTQLALLLEQRTAQHAFRRQSSPPGLAHPLPPQIGRHQADQPGLTIQPLRHCLQLAADLVLREHLEYSGLDGAFLTHCRLRRLGWVSECSGVHPQLTQNRRASRQQTLD
jgi:hypothetical protein